MQSSQLFLNALVDLCVVMCAMTFAKWHFSSKIAHPRMPRSINCISVRQARDNFPRKAIVDTNNTTLSLFTVIIFSETHT